MENSTNISIDAKKAIIGGIIAIIINPVSIIVAFFLGQQLERPKLSIININQKFEYVKPESLTVPDSILKPIKGNTEIFLLSFDIEEEDFENPIQKEDANDLVTSLNSVVAKYEYSINIISKNIQKIVAWNGQSFLDLEFINPQLLGGKSISDAVKFDKAGTINNLKSLLKSSSIKKEEIIKYINCLTPFIENKIKDERTGELIISIGVLNSGKTDAVIFPSMEIKFQDKVLHYVAKDRLNDEEFTVINSHSFRVIKFKIDSEIGNKKDQDEWSALIKNHTSEKFDIKISTAGDYVTSTSQLESK